MVQFCKGGKHEFAKFIPGQMYINGKINLGVVIKNNTFHTWPQSVRNFLCVGNPVKMDLKKMNDKEIEEIRELVAEEVLYSASLIWKVKPTPDELCIDRIEGCPRGVGDLITKARVTKLYPKWGVLNEKIHFRVQDLYIQSENLSTNQSLLKHLAIGDVMGVYMKPVELTDPLYQNDNIKYRAGLVWNINAEVDPYPVINSNSNVDLDISEVKFMITSSTLNCPLPNTSVVEKASWTGVIESIYLPAGGVCIFGSKRLYS